jgi:hypothetical protein
MYSGMVDPAKVQEARRKLCVEAGFIVCKDDKFRDYFQSYLKHKAEAGDKVIVYGVDKKITEKEGLLLRLKRKIKETLRRLKDEPNGN